MTDIKRVIQAERALRDGEDPLIVARRCGLDPAEVEELARRIAGQKSEPRRSKVAS